MCTAAMKVSTSFLSSSSVNLMPSCNASNSRSKNAFLFLPIELKQEKLSALAFQEMTVMVWSWGFTASDIRKWWWRCGPEDLLFQISGNEDEDVVLRIYCFKYQEMMMKVWSWRFTVSDIRKWWWSCGKEDLLFQILGNYEVVVLRIYCFRY